MQRYSLHIGGEACEPHGGTWFDTQNPFTGERWAQIPRGNAQDVDRAVRAAHQALTVGPWSELTATQRGALMRRLGDLIARDAARLAATEVRDNGKLLAEMRGQLDYLPQWFYYYGGLADKVQGSTCLLYTSPSPRD